MGTAFKPTEASATTGRPVSHGSTAVLGVVAPMHVSGGSTMNTGHVGSPTGSLAKATHESVYHAAKAPSSPIIHSKRV